MANLDITRHLLSRQFHYTGARMQQGRSLADSDWNEDALLASEDRRLTLVDLIGAQGSSNNGFAVTDVIVKPPTTTAAGTAASTYSFDFTLQPGSLFVGGFRLAIDQQETFLAQSDWLRQEFEGLPTPPTLAELAADTPPPNNKFKVLIDPPKYRYDLVYLTAWEQPVTAVEDSELRERALGGPDSSARIRRMRRVHVATDVGTDNPTTALESLDLSAYATFNEDTSELVSNARLTVTPIAPAGQLPCGPQPPTGFVGHQDEAIRVELRGRTSITWGYGDAAPLYRVKVGVDKKRITFLNKPRDVRRQPKSQQIVELVPWGAKLPNEEKVAELCGELFRVLKGYDPATGEIVLDQPVPAAWTQWLLDHDEHWNPKDGEEGGGYFYLRIWDRGADTTSDPIIELGSTPVELGKTGLAVSLEGLGADGDYWVIAARRPTPDVVVPWQLLANEAPHGPRKFMTPLAVIRWKAPLQVMTPTQFAERTASQYQSLELNDDYLATWGPVEAEVIDGRRRLQPLCIGGCCTITVGDGTTSHGIVDSLGDALSLLPSSGGRICLLPGTHLAEVELDGRQNVEFCGSELSRLVNTTVVTPTSDITTKGTPLLSLKDCSDITLRGFVISAESAVGVKIYGVNSECENIVIEDMIFDQYGTYNLGIPEYAMAQPAVLALGGRSLTVRSCRVEVQDGLNYTGALVLGGERLRIHDNRVQGGDFESATIATCMGGIHVLSQSTDVEIAGNLIHGGWGHGIALGHVIAWEAAPAAPVSITMADVWTAAERGLGEPVSGLFGYSPEASAPVGSPGVGNDWTSAGALVDVRIDRNHITAMGLTGVSTGMMKLIHTDTIGSSYAAFIVIAGLSVTNNIVVGNRRVTSFSPADPFAPRPDGSYDIAVGGIVISAAIDATIAENRVIDNGEDDSTPNCGLGFIAMQNLVIRDNWVIDNGLEPSATVAEGLRGGVAIMEVTGLRGLTYYDTVHYNVTFSGQAQPSASVGTSKLALQVHKNEISQRSGKALWVRHGFDDILVTENNLHAKGDLARNAEIPNFEFEYHKSTVMEPPGPLAMSVAGACVEILGFSMAPDTNWSAISSPPTLMMVEPGVSGSVGGVVEFSGNRGELDWTNDGGHGCAYLVSSLDSVVLADNVLAANLHAGSGEFNSAFVDTVVSAPGGKSFVLTNCYVGAAGGALVRGNRFIEDKRGALLSVLLGPATQEPIDADSYRHSAVLASCVGSHCGEIFPATAGSEIDSNNIFINKVATATPCDYAPSVTAGPPHLLKLTH